MRLSPDPTRDVPQIEALLIDSSLFTAPYDAALSEGLRENGVAPRWATRRLRRGEDELLDPRQCWPIFYPFSDGPNRRTSKPWRVVKGLEHVLGMSRVLSHVSRRRTDIVHLQWGLLPSIDARFVRRMRRYCAVVMTVHDTTPFNGKDVSRLQKDGFSSLLAACDRLIVHTAGAAEALGATPGLPPITVIPHGLLPSKASTRKTDRMGRWTILMFGKIQDYKGADVLIEALGLLPVKIRHRLKVIIAGEPLIPLGPLRERASALALGECLEIREGRLSEADVGAVLDEADCYVFPYRAIEASGVLFLVANQGKWLIASALGAFRESIGDSGDIGRLVPPCEPETLAEALAESIGRRPARNLSDDVPSWNDIGRHTRDVYEDLLAAR